MTNKKSSFLDLMSDRFDELGRVIIDEETITAIPTGLLSLDACIGIGGIPMGRFTVMDGPESSGKTTVALNIAKRVIQSGKKVLFVDVENQSSIQFIEDIIGEGCVGSGLVLAKPGTAEEGFIIAEFGIESGEFDLIIFDSIGALAPAKEIEKKFDEDSMGLVPRLVSKFLRRNAYAIRINNVAFVFINQIRDLVGSYVKAYTTPGGHALKHYATLIISMTKGDQIKQGKDIIGINSKFTIKKNKLASPFKSFIIPIIFGEGVDEIRDVVSFASTLGVIKRAGPHYKYNDVNIARGMNELIEFLKKDKETLDKIISDVYNTITKYDKEIIEERSEGIEDEQEFED